MSDTDPPEDDPFGPPTEPCECWCLHCERVFMSTDIWFQRIIGDPDGLDGFWMCPTPNCSGAGFTFDIFPTDPDHPANAGWHWDDSEEFEDDDEEAVEEDWDPNEPHWKALDETSLDDEDDDTEGEEWKLGRQPGEAVPEPDSVKEARRQREEGEREYDEPDRRPRELDWSDREPRFPQTGNSEGIREDDIPF